MGFRNILFGVFFVLGIEGFEYEILGWEGRVWIRVCLVVVFLLFRGWKVESGIIRWF